MAGQLEFLGLVVILATGAGMTLPALSGSEKPTRLDWVLLAFGCLLVAASSALMVIIAIGWRDLASYHPMRTGGVILAISLVLLFTLWLYLRRRTKIEKMQGKSVEPA